MLALMIVCCAINFIMFLYHMLVGAGGLALFNLVTLLACGFSASVLLNVKDEDEEDKVPPTKR